MDRAPLTPTEFASAVTAISSAFGDPTRRDIYLFAHESADGVTASEAAAAFDLHPNVARHHLDKLAGGGHLEVRKSRGSSAGRPSKRYRASDPDMNLEIRVGHQDVLLSLLGRSLNLLGPDAAEAVAEEVGRDYGRAMAESMGSAEAAQLSFRAAMQAVADALTAHGFAAHAETSGRQLRIVSEHCPFGGAAIEHPVICAVDRGMVRGMLETLYGTTSTDLESSLPMGDTVCVTTVGA